MEYEFDAILNMNDADFAEQFRKAVGTKPGESIEIITPQFTRTDGIVPAIPVDSWDALRTHSRATLKALGCGAWDEPDENGTVLMMFPHEWYQHIPSGYLLECISGEIKPFESGKTDDDMRFGCLAYGIRVAA